MLGDCANCNCNHMCARLGKSCTGVHPEEVLALYNEEERRIMDAAAYVEATYYMKYTRLQETAAFARKMVALGYYSHNNVSIGYCAEIAGMTEAEFILFLGENGISIFRFENEKELLEDIANA